MTLLNDEVYGIFSLPPPDGALPELGEINMGHVTAADWELDLTWQETLQNLPQDFKQLECSVHENIEECDDDHFLDTVIIGTIDRLIKLPDFSDFRSRISISAIFGETVRSHVERSV